jgi:hypothetical protein
MSKKKQHGNRELKKPKAEKKPAAAPASAMTVAQAKRPPLKGAAR